VIFTRQKVLLTAIVMSFLFLTPSYADVFSGYNTDGTAKYSPEPPGASGPIATPENPSWISNPDGTKTEAEKNYTFLPNAEERAKDKTGAESDLNAAAPAGMIQVGFNPDGSPKFGSAPQGASGPIATPENPFWIKNPDGTQTAAEKSYIFFSGIFFSLACLSRETYFSVISVIIFLITVYLIYQKKNKLIFSLILGFIIPYSIFFFYLFYNNIFYDWISYLQLPKLYLSKYNIKIYQAILNGSFYIFFKTWIEILYKPQNIIISLIVVINSLYFFNHFFFKKKKLDFYLLLISIATLTLTVIAISDEIFRLYTSLIIGIIPALNFIFNIKNKENKIIILFLLIFISLYSFYFFPKGNRSQFEKLNKVNLIENNNLRYFKYQKWSENDWEVLNQIDNITKTVKKKCKIEYGLNYTFDGFYYLILDLKMLQLAPAVTEDENNIFNFFETRFKKKILSNIEKNNLILITNGHFKERYDNKNYKTITLYKDKSNIYRDVVYISFPQKCWNE
jgi:cbb3-type cytochrome oxidase subunit 3